MVGGLFCLQEAALKLCVDANMGGHVVEFSIEGDNALATQGPEVGSTFWPSPQQAWGWPPPNTLDKAAYTVNKHEKAIELLSSVCDRTGLQLKKTFFLHAERLQVTYTMINPGDAPLNFAPWEITRIYGGLTFYESVEPPLALSTGNAAAQEGFVWHQYQPQLQKQNEKVFGNGSSGWLANAYNGLLLVKEFEPVPVSAVAPGEAEIEIYGHGDPQHPYIEVEQQGRYQTLAPKEQLQWQVNWYLYRLPADFRVSVGNKRLPQLVKTLLSDKAKSTKGEQ